MRDNLLRAALLLAALPSGFAFAGGPAMLSVYIEDTHTGSYYWMIQEPVVAARLSVGAD